MPQSAKLAPPNSREVPKSMEGSVVSGTPGCVAVGCRAEIYGETEILLGWDDDVDPGTTPTYVGRLETPTGSVSVRTVLDREIFALQVSKKAVRLRVWTDDPMEPTEVRIGVS